MFAPLRIALIAATLMLFGCSAGGIVPRGPHSLGYARLDSIVRTQSVTYGVPASLVSAVIKAESNGDPSAVSRAGAQGLMQLMPGTSAMYGVANPFDPEMNVSGGTRYLRDLLARYHNNVELAVAAYNAGPGAVDAAHGIPNISETKIYVARVIAAYRGN